MIRVTSSNTQVPLGSPVHPETHPLLWGEVVGPLVSFPWGTSCVNKARFPH